MKEDLRKSLDTALRFQKMLEANLDICEKLCKENPDLNDGLEILITGLHNGTGNILVKLVAQIELIAELLEVLGEQGFDKQIRSQFPD